MWGGICVVLEVLRAHVWVLCEVCACMYIRKSGKVIEFCDVFWYIVYWYNRNWSGRELCLEV